MNSPINKTQHLEIDLTNDDDDDDVQSTDQIILKEVPDFMTLRSNPIITLFNYCVRKYLNLKEVGPIPYHLEKPSFIKKLPWSDPVRYFNKEIEEYKTNNPNEFEEGEKIVKLTIMRQNIVAFYQMHDQVDKLSGYEKYVNKKSIELPNYLEIKALTYEVKKNTLIKIVRDLKLYTENQLGYRIDQPAWTEKSLSRDSVRSYNIYELLLIIKDGYISLGMDIDENFVEDCMEIGNLRNRKCKLILNCDKCNVSNENTEVKYLSNNGKIVNCKLCETCIISFNMNNLEQYEINENDLIIGIKKAKKELESKCQNFYKSLNYPLTKERKLYFMSINGNFSLNAVDYNGYTADIIHRTITHLAYIGLFIKFIKTKYYLGSINITPGYKKYQKFANEIYRNKTIDIRVLHNGSTAEMLLKETLCINIYKDPQLSENNIEKNSNILPPEYQLNQKYYFYILKGIEKDIEISRNIRIDVNDLESLDLDSAISELENGFNLHNLSTFFYRRANKIVNNSTLKSKLKYLNNN